MHILPGLLTLLLAAPAAASPITPLAGNWRGTAETSSDGCSWKVSGFMNEEKGGDGAGEFSYSGPCSKEAKRGIFRGSPSGGSCYKTGVVVGERGVEVSVCFVTPGEAVIKSPMLNGTLKISGDRRTVVFRSSSIVVGSAEGRLRKVPSPSSGEAGTKKKRMRKYVPKKHKPPAH